VPCKEQGIAIDPALDGTVSRLTIMPAAANGAAITVNDVSSGQAAKDWCLDKQELESRVAERTRALSAALTQLHALSAQANSVRDEERSRIAREIHDELGSLLITLKIDLEWLGRHLADREALAAKCHAMIEHIELAVANVGRIIIDLRPGILEHQGLMAALEWQIKEFTNVTDLECDSLIDMSPDCTPPDGELAATAFRIFQEILNNIARHARATAVRIRIRLMPGLLQLDVTDNGVGALPESFEHPHSFGVVGMRERTRQVGGSLHIVSVPGGGTHVCLRLPLN
jgi:signal transduction histidine kinase